ncbi:hypothetical protein [Candidatus Deferrimicrobium sp.]|uniref:hypothetical protein n=1 Tax=Candidatus Deferrimicrobium sp. TaxID=3060586 RepID=UPI003C56EF70
MKKLAVLTAVVLLFGVAGFAAAEYQGNNNDHQNQDPAIQANNNDLVGAKGEQAAAANDGSLAVNVAVDKDVNIDKDVDITKIDKSTEVKAEEGGQAANNGSTNVKQEALLIKNELPGSGDTNSTTDSHNTTTTTTTTSKNTGNDAIGADSAGAKNYSDNPEAENGSQLLQGGGSQTMNTADDGGIVATGAGSVTKNEADKGGMINTGAGNLNKVTNEGKYAAQNASQNITETNVAADGFGNIAAYGSVLTQKAEDGGIAAAPGSAVSKIDLQGSVEHNDIRFGGDVTSVTKSGEAKSIASNYGKAESDEAKTGDAFSISKSKSKSGFAAAVSLGGSKSGGGNGAAALGGAFSESEANATGAALPYVDGNVETLSSNRDRHSGQSQDPGGVEATSDESNAFSANGAAAKSGDSRNYSNADADSGSSKSESESEAKSGSAYSTAANFGKAKSGDATSGDATGAATYQVNRFTTGTNNLAFSGSYNGVGTFNANSGVNALNQSPISINAVVGGNVAGK